MAVGEGIMCIGFRHALGSWNTFLVTLPRQSDPPKQFMGGKICLSHSVRGVSPSCVEGVVDILHHGGQEAERR
jgi:hypothetical protein